MNSQQRSAPSNHPQPALRIAVYCNVLKQHVPVMATEREPQMRMITKFVEAKKRSENWKVETIDTFIDVRRAAKGIDKALQRLLWATRRGSFDTVIAVSRRTIAKDRPMFLTIVTYLAMNGVQLITLQDPLYTATLDALNKMVLFARLVETNGNKEDDKAA